MSITISAGRSPKPIRRPKPRSRKNSASSALIVFRFLSMRLRILPALPVAKMAQDCFGMRRSVVRADWFTQRQDFP